MPDPYTDAEIDTKVANLQTQINGKAATQELSDHAAVNSNITTQLTQRVTSLEANVQQLQQMVASLSYQVSQLS